MNMALEEPTKKGGRYTKKQQEERRLQVHNLHFDENKSAVEIRLQNYKRIIKNVVLIEETGRRLFVVKN